MNGEVETVLDAETITELQPPCDHRFWVEHRPTSTCSATAEFVRKVLCENCGTVSVRLRCTPHLMSGVGSGYHRACDTHGATTRLVSIEPLR